MQHREQGYACVAGAGLEIGALHHPVPVQPGWQMQYADALTKAQQIELFPEIDHAALREPDYLCNLDTGGLDQFADDQYDFVILSHVIEHVANPLAVIKGLFRIVRPFGHVVLACPDKRFTFDQQRAITSFGHLVDEYLAGVTEVSDEHYLDFLQGVHPDVAALPAAELAPQLDRVRKRREHAHVWDSAAFHECFVYTLRLFDIQASCVYQVDGSPATHEYFAVWQKEPSTADRVLNLEQQQAAYAALQTYAGELEAILQHKNIHIVQLEHTIQALNNGRVLRLLNALQRLPARLLQR